MSRFLIRLGLVACLGSSTVVAQTTDHYWEIRPFAGASMPTGAHRDAFKDAALVGGQAALRLTPTVDVVTSLGWQIAESKYGVASKMADVWLYDIGLEKSFRHSEAHHAQLAPFLGAGFGGRAYHFRSASLNGSTCFAAYGSAGAQYEVGRSAVRFALRDDAFCYTAPVGNAVSETRNDVSIVLGVGYRF